MAADKRVLANIPVISYEPLLHGSNADNVWLPGHIEYGEQLHG